MHRLPVWSVMAAYAGRENFIWRCSNWPNAKEVSGRGSFAELILCRLDQAETYLYLNLLLYAVRRRRKPLGRRPAWELSMRRPKGIFSGNGGDADGIRERGHQALQAAQKGFEKEQNQGFLAAVEMILAQSNSRKQPEMKALVAARERLHRHNCRYGKRSAICRFFPSIPMIPWPCTVCHAIEPFRWFPIFRRIDLPFWGIGRQAGGRFEGDDVLDPGRRYT